MPSIRALSPAVPSAALALGLAACSQSAAGSALVAVTASDGACQVETTTLPPGATTFAVHNTGRQTTEFYVYAENGTTIVSEVEDITPGMQRDLTVELKPGRYVYACKPGQVGAGIRGALTVTGATAAPAGDPRTAAAVAAYRTWAAGEAVQLLTATQDFAAAVKAGDVATARARYAPARVHWERIEPVAESFGDLDPKLDARENDVEPGQEWTGWHRLEKQLWVSGLDADSPALADRLVADTKDLVTRMSGLELSASQLGNGAKELLDEVATGKVTGEEERYSHTDLWDFQANVDGAANAYRLLRPVVAQRDASLAGELDNRFAQLDAELAKYQRGNGFVGYDALTQPQIKTLADRVEGLSEPLSRLTVTVVAGQ